MFDALFFVALGCAGSLGGALFWVGRIQRRRARLEPWLGAIDITSGTKGHAVSLRRRGLKRKALPLALSRRLDAAFAATGDRIRALHLAASGIAALVTIWSWAAAVGFRAAVATILAGIAAAGAPLLLLRLSQSRYRRRFVNLFPDALDLIVRGVRAGLPALDAIELVTREIQPPVSTEFRRLLDELHIGTEMEEALQRAAARVRAPDFHFFVVSLLLQRQTGGAIAEPLSNLSAIIRQRKALRSKARALTAEAQASAVIIALTPIVAGFGLFLVNRELMSALFLDPRGRFMLGLAVIGLLLGIGTMKALISRALR
jgi:tight adherence protein B